MTRIVTEKVFSDLSGQEIPDGKAWTMTLTPPDGRRNPVRLDISEAEARQWLARGTEVKRRGRKPGSMVARGALATPVDGRRRRRKTASAPPNGRRRRKTATAPVNGRRRRKTAAAIGVRRKRRTAA